MRERKKKWTALQTPRLMKKEREMFQVPEQRFSCNLWRRPGPWRNTAAGLLLGAVVTQGTQIIPEEWYAMERTLLEQFMKLVGRIHTEEITEQYPIVEEPTLDQKSVIRKEWQSKKVMNWLELPLPVCLHHSGRRLRRVRNAVESELKRRLGVGVFNFVFIYHYSTLFLIYCKLNTFPPSPVCFTCVSNLWMISLSLSQLMTLFTFIFPSCPIDKGEWENGWFGNWQSARLTHHTDSYSFFSYGRLILIKPIFYDFWVRQK